MKLGYACINMTLSKDKITTNRSMIKKTFLQKGLDYCSELAYLNVVDMEKIIKWNVQNGIYLFRTSSNVFPWGSEYDLEELKDIDKIIIDLELHGRVFDMMGLSHTPYNKINIHCNGVYGDKTASLDRWCQNFQLLSHSVRSRLTIENDDKPNMYSVKDLMKIHECCGIPIVFDYHHHQFCTGDLTEKQALELAISTWPEGITPAVHYSSSRLKETGNPKEKPQAHADYILEKINTYGHDLDIMLECKAKELALKRYLTEYGI
jgi:UV DNA damage endonuclease